jgi:hypothetical protein
LVDRDLELPNLGPVQAIAAEADESTPQLKSITTKALSLTLRNDASLLRTLYLSIKLIYVASDLLLHTRRHTPILCRRWSGKQGR